MVSREQEHTISNPSEKCLKHDCITSEITREGMSGSSQRVESPNAPRFKFQRTHMEEGKKKKTFNSCCASLPSRTMSQAHNGTHKKPKEHERVTRTRRGLPLVYIHRVPRGLDNSLFSNTRKERGSNQRVRRIPAETGGATIHSNDEDLEP